MLDDQLFQDSIRVKDRETLMNKLRDDPYKVDLTLLANRIGVSPSTLYAIRANRTKWPRHSTLLSLIHIMGYELWLIKTN